MCIVLIVEECVFLHRLQSRVQFGRDLSRDATEDVELKEIELEDS